MSGPRPFVRRVVVNTAATGASNLWAIAVSVATLPIVLDGLGTDAFGLWALVSTFSVFTGWAALADLGVGTASTRSIARRVSVGDSEGRDRLASAALTISLLPVVLAAVALATAGSHWLPGAFRVRDDLVPAFTAALTWFSAQIVVDQLSRSAQRILEGTNRVDLARLIDSVRRTAALVAVAVAAQATGDLALVARWSFATSVPVALASLVVLGRHVEPRRFGAGETGELIGYGLKVGALKPLGTMHRMMDRMVVAAVLGPSAVTVVEIATQVQNGAEAALSASSYAVTPASSWLDARGDHASQRRLLELGTKYSLLITVPLVVGPAVLAGALIEVWVGPAGAEAAGVVAVAVLYTGLTAVGQVPAEMLVGLGRAGVVIRGAATALVVNLVATLVLVPRIGIVGAFVGSLVGAPFHLRVTVGHALSVVGLSWRELVERSILPVAAPAIALAATAAAVTPFVSGSTATLVVAGLLGAVVYAGATLRWALRTEELREIRACVGGGRPPDVASRDSGPPAAQPVIGTADGGQ